MNNEYIIVNKTAIQKRIEELEKEYILLSNKSDRSLSDIEEEREIVSEQRALAKILSQSTPLIPQIEKAYNTGTNYGIYLQGGSYDPNDNIDIEDYISKLKLDI